MAATNRHNTVLLTVTGSATRDIRKANGVISPGDLLEINSDGDAQRHSDAGGVSDGLVALENTAFNKRVVDDYVDNDQILCAYVLPGTKAQVRIAANASAITKGDQLESDGAGKLRKLTSGEPIFTAEETYDNSASASVAWIEATKI